MKRKFMSFVFAAATLCAVGARAQTPGADQTQAAPQAAPMTKAQKEAKKKADWEAGVKTDCAAEIATGGVCAGMDFGSGLKECLEKNRKTLSDGCKATLPTTRRARRPRRPPRPPTALKPPQRRLRPRLPPRLPPRILKQLADATCRAPGRFGGAFFVLHRFDKEQFPSRHGFKPARGGLIRVRRIIRRRWSDESEPERSVAGRSVRSVPGVRAGADGGGRRLELENDPDPHGGFELRFGRSLQP